MASDADNGIEFQASRIGSRTIWRAGAALLGASLWAQLFWYPLATEFLSGEAGAVYVLAYSLPTLALFVSVIVDEGAGYMFFVPGSFVPGMVLLPQQDVGSLLQLHRALFVVGTLVSYLFVAALSLRGPREEDDETDELEGPERHVAGVYSHYTAIRIVILVVLFAILVGAGLFDPSVTSAIATHHGEGRVLAQVFVVVFGFFTWCVVAYTMFFLPAANLEYDVRRLSREIDAMVGDAAAVRWRLGLTVAVGLSVLGLALTWQLLA